MKIILQHQGKMTADFDERLERGDIDEEFALDDTAFDSSGWISVEVGGISVATIHINDLMPAAIAYNSRYMHKKLKDKRQ